MSTQEEQLVMAGDEAGAILNGSAFNSVINELVERTFQTLSLPTRTKENMPTTTIEP